MATIDTPSEPGGGAAEEPLGVLLKRAHKVANHLLRHLIEPLGLTPVQAAALGHLLARESLSLNELADRMQADAPTLSGVVDCLVASGYAERREDPRDRRRLRLFATEKASQVREALRQAEERREAVLTRGLDAAEVARLKVLLRHVGAALDEE